MMQDLSPAAAAFSRAGATGPALASAEGAGPAASLPADALFSLAAGLAVAEQRCSTTWLQKKFGIGYNKAAHLVERLEAAGIVSAADHLGKRTVASREMVAAALAAAQAVDPSELDIDVAAEKQAAATAAARPGRAVPMKETDADREVRDRATSATADELRQFVERAESLNAEKAEISDQFKEVMAEAKGRGFNTKVLRKIIALRKRDKNEVDAEDAILDLYKTHLGMA